MRTIKSRLILFFSFISVGCMTVAFGIVAWIAGSSFTKCNDQLQSQSARHYASVINGWLEKETVVIDSAKIYLESQKNLDRDSARIYLENLTSASENASDIYAGFSDKSFIDGTGWIPDADWDCTQRSWYTACQNTDQKVYGNPYVDVISGNMVIGVSRTFTCAGGQSGVISMDLNLQTLFQMMEESIDSADGSYAFLTNAEGEILLHPSDEFNPSADRTHNIAEVLDGGYTTALEQGKIVRDYDGLEKHLEKASVECNGWQVVIAIPESSYSASLYALLKAFLIIILLSVFATVIIVALYSGTITKPIVRMKNQINELKDFHLQAQPQSGRTRRDELGTMEQSIRHLKIT